MNNLHAAKPIKPKSILYRSLNFKFKDLFKYLGKAVIDGSIGNFSGVAKDLTDAGSAIGLDKEDNNQLIWILIYNSLAKAIVELINEDLIFFENLPEESKIEKLCNELEENMDAPDFFIDESFFKSPGTIDFIVKAENFFLEWLKAIDDLELFKAKSISSRLPSYFVFSLNDEWRNNQKRYNGLKEFFDTPFTKASKEEQNWSLYHSWLKKQCEEKVFEETFSLRQIYIPLRAYYKKKQNEKESTYPDKIVVDLEEELSKWVDLRDASDSLRIISGGPGCGKSSFCKIFSAKQAEKNLRVLFIPLHRLKINEDLVEAVNQYIKYDAFLTENPLDPQLNKNRLLVVFDGLDELAMQGEIGAEASQNFIQEVKNQLRNFNVQKLRIQILISGRELTIQESENELRNSTKILHILPYFVKNKYNRYIDNNKLLEFDQRDFWWKKYGEATGQIYEIMPVDLKKDNLVEITSQPLLNYLVALSYSRGQIDFSKETNLNNIYDDLLKAVYERGWAGHRHASVKKIEENLFLRILEEIAIAAWHGKGRTTTISEVQKYCETNGLINFLKNFEDGVEKGLSRLFIAFYFRQSGLNINNDKTFEFTHKSFGEYLTARRIISSLKHVNFEFRRKKESFDGGYDEKDTLIFFVKICGKKSIDEYLLKFIENEIYLQKKEDVYLWQETLCRLIEYITLKGMPMENLQLNTFQEECILARNAEEALIVLLSACSSFTKKITKINWPDPDSFMLLYKRLVCKKGNVFAIKNLKFIDLKNCNLKEADLSEAYLSGAYLEGANLKGAYLSGATIEGATIEGGNLSGAYLEGANLKGSDLKGANLKGVNLKGANLKGADADFGGAYLKGAYLRGAYLKGADLSGAYITLAYLKGAKI